MTRLCSGVISAEEKKLAKHLAISPTHSYMSPSRMDSTKKKSKCSSKLDGQKRKSSKLNQDEARSLLLESSLSDMSDLSEDSDSEWTISRSPVKKTVSSIPASENPVTTPKQRMNGLVSPINLKRKSSIKVIVSTDTEISEPLKETVAKDNSNVESPNYKRRQNNSEKNKRSSAFPDSPSFLASERTPRKCRSIYKSPTKNVDDSENEGMARRKRSVTSKCIRSSPRPMKEVNYCEESPPKRGRRSSVRFNDSPTSTPVSQLKTIPQSPTTPVDGQPEVCHTPTRSPALRSPRTPRTPSNTISLRKQVLESRASAKKKLGFGTDGSPKARRSKASKEDDSEDEDDVFVSSPSRPSSRPSTPSSPRVTPRKSVCPRVGQGFLTPQLAGRNSSRPAMSSLEQLTSRLHVSTVPTSLPCRQKEFDNINAFILTKILYKSGGCMYVSGVPGTGKTATTHAVVRSLQQEAVDGEISPFDFVEVNGLRLTDPRQAYVRIWQNLSGNKVSVAQALSFLEKRFSSRSKSSTVLLVDEVDYVCNRRQDVVYNLVEWSTWTHSRLILIFIANTMDLPERTLKGKIASRMGLTRLVFQPYNYKQLQEIVTNRLMGNPNFHADAIQLVSRKVAAVSGDARRALEICRSAVQLVGTEQGDGSGIIDVSHVGKAITQIFSGTRVQAIKHCGLMGQLVLRSVRDECQRTVTEETDIRRAFSHLQSLCALEGVTEPNACQMMSVCRQLAASGLLTMESPCRDVLTKLSLNVSPDDIHYALSPQSND